MSNMVHPSESIFFTLGLGFSPFVVVGEAPGREEVEQGKPFVGKSGKLLFGVIREVSSIPRDVFHVTNVFLERPDNNKIMNFFTPDKDLADLSYPSYKRWYVKADKSHHVKRLHEELNRINAKYVLLAGTTPFWAFFGDCKMSDIVGNFIEGENNVIFFPVYHPSYILRNKSVLPLYENHLSKFCNFIKKTDEYRNLMSILKEIAES